VSKGLHGSFFAALLFGASALILLQSAAMASPVSGSPADSARAEALFFDGRRLLAGGELSRACTCFFESSQLAPRAGTLLNLGLCREQEGRFLDAYHAFQQALAVIAETHDRQDRKAIGEEHLAIVEARLAWLDIALPEGPEPDTASLFVDGAKVTPSDWHAVPVEVGHHVLSVSIAGRFVGQATLDAGINSTGRASPVSVALLSRIPAPSETKPLPPAVAVVAIPAEQRPVTHLPVYRRLWFWSLIGGAVAAGAVAAFLIPRRSIYPHSDLTTDYP